MVVSSARPMSAGGGLLVTASQSRLRFDRVELHVAAAAAATAAGGRGGYFTAATDARVHDWWAVGCRQFVSPVGQRDNDRRQVAAFLGEHVLVVVFMAGVGASLQDPCGNEGVEM